MGEEEDAGRRGRARDADTSRATTKRYSHTHAVSNTSIVCGRGGNEDSGVFTSSKSSISRARCIGVTVT